MSAPPVFGTQLIGQTEKALSAILHRELADTGLSEPQWVTLTLTIMTDDRLDRDAFARRVSDALKISPSDAADHIRALAMAGMLNVPEAEAGPITVTPAAAQLHKRIRAAIAEITARLWGDIPADRLATTAEVLRTVLARAGAELGRAS